MIIHVEKPLIIKNEGSEDPLLHAQSLIATHSWAQLRYRTDHQEEIK
jgi:hypothetical protein